MGECPFPHSFADERVFIVVNGPASGELPANSPGGGVFDGVAVVPVFVGVVVVLGVVGAAEGHTVGELSLIHI